MLTSYHQDGMILRSLAAGAKGYLLKDVDLTEVKKTVRLVYRGNAVLDPRVATRVITVATTTTGGAVTPALKHATLSEMDIAIVRQLANGLSNKEIAARVHRSPHTVKDRLEKIAGVLGVHARTEIVAEALRTGLI